MKQISVTNGSSLFDYMVNGKHRSEYGQTNVPLDVPTIQANDKDQVDIVTCDNDGLHFQTYTIELI